MSGKTSSSATILPKRRRLDLDDKVHIACLTNKQLIVELLVAAKKSIGKKAHEWLLSEEGQKSFIRVGKNASGGKILPSEWISTFTDLTNKDGGGKLIIPSAHGQDDGDSPFTKCAHLGELLAKATKELFPSSHKDRLSHALELIATLPGTSLDIRKTTALLDASTEAGNEEMQDQTFSLVQENLPKGGDILDVLVSVQVSVLQKINSQIFNSLVLSEQLDGSLLKLFIKQNNENIIEKGKDYTNTDTMRVRRFVEAAELARRGDQLGSKHGCVICVSRNAILGNTDLMGKMGDSMSFESSSRPSDYDIVIGRGWNHNAFENKRGFGRKRMIHAEVHAVADACRSFGETLALEHLFPKATVIIVELYKNTTYDDAPPCPKCEQLLRGVGVQKACHSTDKGSIQSLQLAPPNPDFLSRDVVTVPFKVACEEIGVKCTFIKESYGQKE